MFCTVLQGDSIRREGVLEKRITAKEITWAPRFVTLTDSMCYAVFNVRMLYFSLYTFLQVAYSASIALSEFNI